MREFVFCALLVGAHAVGVADVAAAVDQQRFPAPDVRQPMLEAAPGLAAAQFLQVSAQAQALAHAHAQAQWRFGSNYVPQHYGNWQFSEGSWNFGNDKRIECEACGYVMYMLIDRLGDEFNKKTVVDEITGGLGCDSAAATEGGAVKGRECGICDRVQWVFQSGCDHILKRSPQRQQQIIDQVMRLTEPEDICKGLNFCAPDFYDSQMSGGTPGAAMPGAAGTMGSGMPWHGSGQGIGMAGNGGAVSMGTPGVGYQTGQGASMYPSPGSKPLSPHSPYSPYSYGGYDPFGYPLPHPGVPSSTPPPPAGVEAAPAAFRR